MAFGRMLWILSLAAIQSEGTLQHSGLNLFLFYRWHQLLLIGGLTLTSVTLQQAGRNAQQYMSSVLLARVTAGVAAVVKVNGRQFCSRPRLCRVV
ncbi:hypothetical protein ACFX2H_032761 [Malus domestica]